MEDEPHEQAEQHSCPRLANPHYFVPIKEPPNHENDAEKGQLHAREYVYTRQSRGRGPGGRRLAGFKLGACAY